MNFSGIPSGSLIGRMLRWPLNLIPSGAILPILQGPLRGKKWIAGSSTHGCWLGSVEHDKQRAFAQAVAPGCTIYDLGANVGLYTLLSSVLVGPAGHVYAFEPLPRNIRYLRRHLAMNKVNNCTIVEAAVSSQDGHDRFDPSSTHTNAHLSEVGAERVRTVMLDSLIARSEILPPDVVKIDIEGGELRALQGFRGTIRERRPTIFLATHGQELHRACLGFLQEHDYKLDSLTSEPIDSSAEIVATPNRH
jgi:FkbM family methyltransferase